MEFSEIFQWSTLIPWILGMVFGIFVGATPGLTATMAVALIVPLSYYLPANAGLALIIGVSFTAIFAGDIPATYLRIPGTPASAAATLDGYQMARQGKGYRALCLDLWCSCLGGLIGVGLLMAVAPQLARLALKFSSFEYFWLALFGLSMSAVVSAGHTFHGLMAATFGMLLSTIGLDIVSGAQRFTYGQTELMDGVQFIPVMIGLFGLSEVMRHLWAPDSDTEGSSTADVAALSSRQKSSLFTSLWRQKRLIGQSSLLGTLIGALPGAGADIAAWGSYGLAQKTSHEPERFGKGSEEGVIAPTSANNAAVAGAWIPALVFGIPGDAVTAIVLGALMVYDIKPGPMVFEQSGGQVQAIFMIALITQCLLLPAGWIGIRTFDRLLKCPRRFILTAVVLFSVVGAYSLQSSLFDVGIMIGFGCLGFLLERCAIPLAPLILGLILGPMVEKNLRTGLIKTEGDWLPFINRPFCLILFCLLSALLIGPWVYRRLRKTPSGG